MKAALLACVADLAPDLAPDALAEIDARLSPLAASVWPEVAWRFSRLTGDGFPVEFAFSSHDDNLRLTLEPQAPEHSLAGVEADGRTLRWGEWLSLRQSGSGLKLKRYLEADRGSVGEAPAWLAGRSRMTGLDPDGSTETYYDLSGAMPAQVECLLAGWGVPLPDRLLPGLERLWDRPFSAGLKFIGLGCSHARDPQGRTRAAALFFRAAAVPGSAERVRAAILAGQVAAGYLRSAYRRLWAASSAAALPAHGVVSLIDAPGRPLEVRCGVSGRAVLEAHAAVVR